MARSFDFIELTIFFASSLAFSRRVGRTSEALMLAELSIARTNRSPWLDAPRILGPARASITRRTARSWRNSRRFFLSRWNRLLTWRSSMLRRQSRVLGTWTGLRRSLRK